MSARHIFAIILVVLVGVGGIPALIQDTRAGRNFLAHAFGIIFVALAAYYLWATG